MPSNKAVGELGAAVVVLDRRRQPLTAIVCHMSPALDAVAQMILAAAELVS
jgi:hypothetical protein